MRYQNYELDPFQVQAVEAIDRGESLIVAAPTGCGKTLIAEYAVDVSIERNKKVIYTAPIKALSNQKYRDFRKRFGEEVVGIQTGDVTINPDGKLLIMTTEIMSSDIRSEQWLMNWWRSTILVTMTVCNICVISGNPVLLFIMLEFFRQLKRLSSGFLRLD